MPLTCPLASVWHPSLQIYRIILEYPSNIYIFLDIFQLSTLFYSIIQKLVLTMNHICYPFHPCHPWSLNHLPSIFHLLPQYRTQYHLYILHKRIVPIVIAVKPHLIRIQHISVIPLQLICIPRHVWSWPNRIVRGGGIC